MEDVVKPINTENDMETGTKLQLINIKDLERQKELGSGHFGVVYKGIYKTKHNDEPINIPVAIKILKKSSYIKVLDMFYTTVFVKMTCLEII